VPPFVLTVLKILLLALLYLFIYRAVRAIVADLYGRGGPRKRRGGKGEARPARGAQGTPRRVVVMDEQGRKVATHRLDGTLQIGRSSACQIRPDDTYLSQIHARISPRGEGWVVEDLGSTNGTYLNKRKVAVPTGIAPGDRIRLGKTTIEVRR
jgi:hypothetical protein